MAVAAAPSSSLPLPKTAAVHNTHVSATITAKLRRPQSRRRQCSKGRFTQTRHRRPLRLQQSLCSDSDMCVPKSVLTHRHRLTFETDAGPAGADTTPDRVGGGRGCIPHHSTRHCSLYRPLPTASPPYWLQVPVVARANASLERHQTASAGETDALIAGVVKSVIKRLLSPRTRPLLVFAVGSSVRL